MSIKCPDCGAENISAAESCVKCGAALKPQFAKVEKSSQTKLPFIKRIIPRRGQTRKG